MTYTRLSMLTPGQFATITKIESLNARDVQALAALGFFLGATVCIEHEAPISHDPIAVRVRGALIAIRRVDADGIQVTLV